MSGLGQAFLSETASIFTLPRASNDARPENSPAARFRCLMDALPDLELPAQRKRREVRQFTEGARLDGR